MVSPLAGWKPMIFRRRRLPVRSWKMTGAAGGLA